jgi:hypothetical protein
MAKIITQQKTALSFLKGGCFLLAIVYYTAKPASILLGFAFWLNPAYALRLIFRSLFKP